MGGTPTEPSSTADFEILPPPAPKIVREGLSAVMMTDTDPLSRDLDGSSTSDSDDDMDMDMDMGADTSIDRAFAGTDPNQLTGKQAKSARNKRNKRKRKENAARQAQGTISIGSESEVESFTPSTDSVSKETEKKIKEVFDLGSDSDEEGSKPTSRAVASAAPVVHYSETGGPGNGNPLPSHLPSKPKQATRQDKADYWKGKGGAGAGPNDDFEREQDCQDEQTFNNQKRRKPSGGSSGKRKSGQQREDGNGDGDGNNGEEDVVKYDMKAMQRDYQATGGLSGTEAFADNADFVPL